MTRPTSRFVAAIAAAFIVLATAVPVVTVPAHTAGATLTVVPALI